MFAQSSKFFNFPPSLLTIHYKQQERYRDVACRRPVCQIFGEKNLFMSLYHDGLITIHSLSAAEIFSAVIALDGTVLSAELCFKKVTHTVLIAMYLRKSGTGGCILFDFKTPALWCFLGCFLE